MYIFKHPVMFLNLLVESLKQKPHFLLQKCGKTYLQQLTNGPIWVISKRTIASIRTTYLQNKISLIGQINKVLYTASLKLLVKQRLGSSKPNAQVFMELNYGICLKIILSQFVMHGG